MAQIKLDNNNSNCVIIDTGEVDKLKNTDQVIKPNSIIVKVE